MVALGRDNINNSNTAFVSANVLGIAKSSPVRVMIVPVNFKFQEVMAALVPCDFNAIDTLNKINHLRSSPRWQDVRLLVVNVNDNGRHLRPGERFMMEE